MKYIVFILVSLLFLACQSDSFGLVGKAQFKGEGQVWTDGVVTVALGDIEGSMGVYGKATGIALILPAGVQVDEGQVFLSNLDLGIQTVQEKTKPIPQWAASVFLPGEAESLGLTFEGYTGPGDTVPPSK